MEQTHTHTHSQNRLPYTSLAHAYQGIINKATKNVPNSETIPLLYEFVIERHFYASVGRAPEAYGSCRVCLSVHLSVFPSHVSPQRLKFKR